MNLHPEENLHVILLKLIPWLVLFFSGSKEITWSLQTEIIWKMFHSWTKCKPKFTAQVEMELLITWPSQLGKNLVIDTGIMGYECFCHFKSFWIPLAKKKTQLPKVRHLNNDILRCFFIFPVSQTVKKGIQHLRNHNIHNWNHYILVEESVTYNTCTYQKNCPLE